MGLCQSRNVHINDRATNSKHSLRSIPATKLYSYPLHASNDQRVAKCHLNATLYSRLYAKVILNAKNLHNCYTCHKYNNKYYIKYPQKDSITYTKYLFLNKTKYLSMCVHLCTIDKYYYVLFKCVNKDNIIIIEHIFK